jgi:hypothetical protein
MKGKLKGIVRCLHGRAVLSFMAMVVASACSSGATPSPPPPVEVAASPPPEEESRTVDEPAAEPAEPPAAAPLRVSLAGVEVFGRCYLKTPGVYGSCIDTATCTSTDNHVSTPGLCGGPPNVSCCTEAPRAEIHPPAGWNSVPQTRVTGDMYSWALSIVGSPAAYPMGSKTTQVFGAREVMARVEWHPPNLGHGVMHRGVTLYEPL